MNQSALADKLKGGGGAHYVKLSKASPLPTASPLLIIDSKVGKWWKGATIVMARGPYH